MEDLETVRLTFARRDSCYLPTPSGEGVTRLHLKHSWLTMGSAASSQRPRENKLKRIAGKSDTACLQETHIFLHSKTQLCWRSMLISRAQRYALPTHVFLKNMYKDKRVTLKKKQNNVVSNSAAFITETNQVMWSPLTNTIPHGRTIVHTVTSATEASMVAVGHFAKTFDPGKHGLQLTDDSVMRLKK